MIIKFHITQYISILFEHSLFNGYLVINAGK